MGSAKDDWLDRQEQQAKEAWISHYASSDDCVEGSEEWGKLEQEFEYKKLTGELDDDPLFSDFSEEDQYIEDVEMEISWSKRMGYQDAYDSFMQQMVALEYTNPKNRIVEKIFLKMKFSYAVTLMESCLSEMLKSVALYDDYFKGNAIAKVKDLKDFNLKLTDIFKKDTKDIIEQQIYIVLTEELYHNVSKVMVLYSLILNVKDLGIDDQVKEGVNRAIKLRHDVAHRNGRDKKGVTHILSEEVIDEHLLNIQKFVTSLYKCVDVAMDDRDNKVLEEQLNKK
ncbi:hypothetical protein WKG92_19695 [Pantoea agglomerans]|uniref:hypothetical protein n=1 Tax=Enterobacter agglomerans TaxID=549 RepID=UPI003C7A2A13